MRAHRRFLLVLAAAVIGGPAYAAHHARPTVTPAVFHVGGAYVKSPTGPVMQGAMYVEHWRPAKGLQPYPVVFFHGAGMTGASWVSTPDGRPGWAPAFLNRGFDVYVVDQPLRGRSGWDLAATGAMTRFEVAAVERMFTASERHSLWPQAKLHSQWPGSGPEKGLAGDPAFDAFYASTVPYLDDNAETQRLAQAAGVALLDKIGPAILVTHSQAGAFGWLIADKRPDLVKGIVAMEPLAPPAPQAGPGRAARAWGPTDIPLAYAPAVTEPAELGLRSQTSPDAPGLAVCSLQQAPAHQLPNLAHAPILLAVGEASYHAAYDHCTAAFLTQAGAKVDFVRLADAGLHGNGHMMMLEKNSDAIASFIITWLSKAGLARRVTDKAR